MNLPEDEKRAEIMRRYGPLLCDGCRVRLVDEMSRIKLKAGSKIGIGDVMRIMNALCPACLKKIMARMRR